MTVVVDANLLVVLVNQDPRLIYHRLSLGSRVIEIALTLERQSAYDAAYLALTESLNAELWTLDLDVRWTTLPKCNWLWFSGSIIAVADKVLARKQTEKA